MTCTNMSRSSCHTAMTSNTRPRSSGPTHHSCGSRPGRRWTDGIAVWTTCLAEPRPTWWRRVLRPQIVLTPQLCHRLSGDTTPVSGINSECGANLVEDVSSEATGAAAPAGGGALVAEDPDRGTAQPFPFRGVCHEIMKLSASGRVRSLHHLWVPVLRQGLPRPISDPQANQLAGRPVRIAEVDVPAAS